MKKILLSFFVGCSILLACQNKKENTEKKEAEPTTQAEKKETPTEKDSPVEGEKPAEEKKTAKEEKKRKPNVPKPPVSAKAKLMGKWQSTDDANNFVTFQPNNTDDPNISGFMTEGGQKRGSFIFCEKGCLEYFKNQDGLSCDGMGFRLREPSGENIDYCIISLTRDKLEYSMLGGRGNTLSFKKVR